METKHQPAEAVQNREEKRLSPEEQQKLRKRIRRSERTVKSYQSFFLRLIVFLLVLWVLFFQIMGVTICASADMHPRVDAGDMVLFYRLDKDVRAQDVIVIEKESDGAAEPKVMVLRVVAVAGAARSTKSPWLEEVHGVPSSLVPATARTPGMAAG